MKFSNPKFPVIRVADRRPLVWIPKARKYRLRKINKGSTVYDNIINFNKHGFRVTESKGINQSKHLFLNGCSATFGQGLKDHESFPYLLSKELKSWNVVNMGLRGSRVQDHMYFWRAFNFPEIFPQTQGMMIYTLIPDHFERLVRSWRYLGWAFYFSTVFKEQNSEFIYDGILADKWDYSWSRLMKKTQTSYYWWLRLSSYHSDYLLKNSESKMALMLLDLKRTYLKQYPKGKFVVT